MDKLIKQLQRDFKKNPKKVVLLGGLFVVCLWVVVPLFLPEAKKPVNRAPVAAAVAPSSAGANTAAAAAPTWRWQDLNRALQDDPRMRSTGGETNTAVFPPPRNPFETPFDVDAAMNELLEEIAAEMKAEQTVAASSAAPDQTLFETVPLQLSSTIVGVGPSIAVINGRPFRQGAKIGTSYGKDLILQSVDPRSAVVAWNGVTRTLRIPSLREATPQASLAGTRPTP